MAMKLMNNQELLSRVLQGEYYYYGEVKEGQGVKLFRDPSRVLYQSASTELRRVRFLSLDLELVEVEAPQGVVKLTEEQWLDKWYVGTEFNYYGELDGELVEDFENAEVLRLNYEGELVKDPTGVKGLMAIEISLEGSDSLYVTVWGNQVHFMYRRTSVFDKMSTKGYQDYNELAKRVCERMVTESFRKKLFYAMRDYRKDAPRVEVVGGLDVSLVEDMLSCFRKSEYFL